MDEDTRVALNFDEEIVHSLKVGLSVDMERLLEALEVKGQGANAVEKAMLLVHITAAYIGTSLYLGLQDSPDALGKDAATIMGYLYSKQLSSAIEKVYSNYVERGGIDAAN